ncbi:hypothetical protein MTBLM1_90027 [Rhodospirillaceae bacterium LM-1]|nr:hypothetical protein MTBLM1_90027 [Rhodospirillaceae bacterium LM-1]
MGMALRWLGGGLKNQAGRGGFAAGTRQSQELGPLLQAAELAHAKARPTAACGPGRGGD